MYCLESIEFSVPEQTQQQNAPHHADPIGIANAFGDPSIDNRFDGFLFPGRFIAKVPVAQIAAKRDRPIRIDASGCRNDRVVLKQETIVLLAEQKRPVPKLGR